MRNLAPDVESRERVGGRELVLVSELANRESWQLLLLLKLGIGADLSFQLIWGTKQVLCPEVVTKPRW